MYQRKKEMLIQLRQVMNNLYIKNNPIDVSLTIGNSVQSSL